MKKDHVISNDEVYPFLPCYWAHELFIEMSKKICVSGFHVHFKRNKSFISLDKLSPPAQPGVCLISPQLLFNPLSPNIQIQTLQTDLHTFPARID